MAVWTRLDKLTSKNAAHLKENIIALVLQYSDSQKKKASNNKDHIIWVFKVEYETCLTTVVTISEG